MTARARLVLLVLAAFLSSLIATPAYAAGEADLVVALTNRAEAKAGKRIAYTITVKNKGPARADHVEIEFETSAALRRITYTITDGHCYRSPHQVECLVYRIKSGKTATATISGVMPKKIKNGTAVTNTVAVTSRTRLVNTGNDRASDNYRLGVPRVAPVIPSPTPSSANSIDKATNVAAKVFSFSRSAVTITYVVLGAGILWFIIGLTLRKISRGRRGVAKDSEHGIAND